jgi:hypothetical protein
MAAFKDQTFQERTALAAKAKQAALDKLRAKPPVDEAIVAQRRAAAEAREQAQAEARAAKLAAREQAAADKRQRAIEAAQAAEAAAAAAAAAAEAAKPYKPKMPTEAEMKAARDARYAARKKRAQ